tara:strand:+ start:66 stop:800 length:735 start_codon:yes stop_codon:yes gene_type:complete
MNFEAPRGIPGEYFQEYSMNGQIGVEYKYANDCSEEVQKLFNDNFTQEVFDQYIQKAKNKEQNYYGPTDTWLYESLEKYPIRDKNICIMGSANPWYEAIAISYGVKNCTVIEYSKRKAFHEKIIYKQPHEVGDQKFDVCFSISSFEHDGLGRYGDPLNPNGDLEAMKKTKDLLHKDGLLYLAVPTGYDWVYFNVHRIYGRHRFPKLIEGWEKVDEFGFFEDTFTNNANGLNGTPYQPLCVLKNI